MDATVKVTDMAGYKPNGSALPGGTELNQYRLLHKIGQGGFGITYLAINTANNEQVVIKENLPSFCAYRNENTLQVKATDGDVTNRQYSCTLKRFKDEARFLKNLQHPNIVRVYDDFEALGTAYYVMPYIRGKELHRAVPATVNEAWLAPILRALLSALDYLHQNSLLHRDLKPSNILLQEDGSPIIIDFGTARDLHTERTSTMMVGTHGYTPSEQMIPLGKIGPWTDIYALGATCYRLITGKVPPESVARLEDESLYSPLRENKELCKRFSPILLKSIDIALSTRAPQRWQTAGEWLNYLITPSEHPTPGTPRTPRNKLFLTISSLAIAALLSAIAVAVYFLTAEQAEETPATTSATTHTTEAEPPTPEQQAIISARNKLTSMGISDYGTAIVAAYNDPYKLRILLAAGAPVNKAAADGKTPLHLAIQYKITESVNILLAAEHIDINLADNSGATPLHTAVECNHTEYVKLLLAATGIDCNLTDRQGATPLQKAISLGHTKCAELLLTHTGVDINEGNEQGETLLFLAAMHGRKNSMELLLALPGIDVNKADKYGRTPLCIAAEKGQADCVKLLLAAPGIAINQEASWGSTPLSIAAYEGHAPCVKLLLAAPGIDVNKANKYGNTALDSAARAGHTECVKLLLTARGIKVNQANNDGVTPLKAAAAAGHTECAKLIRKAGGK